MTLFINACVGSRSRTEQIAKAYLNDCMDVVEVDLDELYLEPLDAQTLRNRDLCIAQGRFNHSYFNSANQFAEADEIVIAAPYWDLSFPAKLWTYLENICIPGLTFRCKEDGTVESLCCAERLIYITTAGGRFHPEFSYNYIRTLAEEFFGIRDTRLIYAENLDAAGSNPQQILNDCIRQYCLG